MNTKAVIYVKDIQKINGKSYRASQSEFKKIKDSLNLSRSEYLTISAYCQHTKISINDAFVPSTSLINVFPNLIPCAIISSIYLLAICLIN